MRKAAVLVVGRTALCYAAIAYTSAEKCRNYSINQTWKAAYEGWNFNSGNYLFTTDTK